MVSGLLHVSQNAERFQYLVVAKEYAAEAIGEFSDKLNTWAKSFMLRRNRQLVAVQG